MGWLHNAKLKRRADEAFDEGDTVLFSLPDALEGTPIEDVHRAIIDAVVEDFRKKTGLNITADPLAYWRVYEASARSAVMIKCGSGRPRTMSLMFLSCTASGPKHMHVNPTLSA